MILRLIQSLSLSLFLLLSGSTSLTATGSTDILPPTTGYYSDFGCESFTAHWSPASAAESYALNVWSVGNEARSNVQDFCDAPVILEGDGTHLATQSVKGRITDIVIAATLLDADDVQDYTQTNVFKVELYDDEGTLLSYGQTYSWLFLNGYELHLADAFSTLYDNLHHANLSLVHSDGSCGSVRIDRITICYDAYEYLAEDVQTSATSYLVSGIDPNKIYYFNVASRKGTEQSAFSPAFKVDFFPVPVPTPPSDLTEDSYTAQWEPSFKAEGYIVRNYATQTTSADDTQQTILADAFDACTEGSFDAPVSIENPDPYTTTPGWTGNMFLMAKGALGAEGGQWVNGRPMTGYLITPQMDLASDDGIYTIHLKAKGTPGDQLAVYHTGYLQDGKLNIHYTQPFDDDGWMEETWQMSDGSESMTLSIESKGMKPYFLDEIAVSQQLTGGTLLRTLLSTVRVEGGESASTTFSHLSSGSTYAYDVRAIRTDFYGYEEETDCSPLQMVTLPDGIDGIAVRPVGKTMFWHSISGQRLNHPRQGGLYISPDGQKIRF